MIDKAPSIKKSLEFDNVSFDAPFRTINGNSNPVELKEFISCLEKNLNKKAIIKYVDNKMGDVSSTWADTKVLKNLTKFSPKTKIDEGIRKFLDWYLEYFK